MKNTIKKDYENKYKELKKILAEHKKILDEILEFHLYQAKVMHWHGRNLLWFQKSEIREKLQYRDYAKTKNIKGVIKHGEKYESR